MGKYLSQISNNYEIPTITKYSQSLTLQKSTSKLAFYSQDYFDKTIQVPSYSLKRKKQMSLNEIRNEIYTKPQHLKILTYNIWFEDHNAQCRYTHILKMIEQSKADIICLQEVNSNFLNMMHNNSNKLTTQYFIPITQMHWYDTLILSKFPCRFYKKPFQQSTMGRCNLAALIQFQQKQQKIKFAINSVHLQSLNSTKFRIQQLQEIKKMNQFVDFSVIAGDFNFTDGWEQDKSIPPYIDIWKTGKKIFNKFTNQQQRQTGYTMPPSKRFAGWRPDHIIYKTNKKYELQKNNEIQIIGNFTIYPFQKQDFLSIIQDQVVKTPSDHFGLISKLYL